MLVWRREKKKTLEIMSVFIDLVHKGDKKADALVFLRKSNRVIIVGFCFCKLGRG